MELHRFESFSKLDESAEPSVDKKYTEEEYRKKAISNLSKHRKFNTEAMIDKEVRWLKQVPKAMEESIKESIEFKKPGELDAWPLTWASFKTKGFTIDNIISLKTIPTGVALVELPEGEYDKIDSNKDYVLLQVKDSVKYFYLISADDFNHVTKNESLKEGEKFGRFTEQPDGSLKISLDGTEDKDEMTDFKGSDDEFLWTFFESELTNGFFLVGDDHKGLTEAPVISNEVIDDETSKEAMQHAKVWAFTDYQVVSVQDELLKDGEVIFKKV